MRLFRIAHPCQQRAAFPDAEFAIARSFASLDGAGITPQSHIAGENVEACRGSSGNLHAAAPVV
jgi:hypothetical protein